MKINICYALNDANCSHCAVSIASMLYNSNKKDKYKIYILSDFISSFNQQKLKSLKKIRKFDIEFVFDDFEYAKNFKHHDMPLHECYIYKIFDLIKEDKILYLDFDTMIRKDVAALYDTDFEEKLCIGVEDIMSISCKKWSGFDEKTDFINSGVMLLNLKRSREENISQKIFDFIKTPQGEKLRVNYVVNYVFQNKIKTVDIIWNHMYCFYNEYKDQKYYTDSSIDPSIVHYISDVSPWNTASQPNKKNEYIDYLELTPYYEEYLIFTNIKFQETLIKNLCEIKNLLTAGGKK